MSDVNIKACVDDYILCVRLQAREEMKFYSKQKTLSEAIRVAATCQRADGKRHSHQRRISGTVLHEAEQQLLAHQKALQTKRHFAGLHEQIDALIGPIKGIGALAVYDIAHRIAAFLGFEPDQVYLHAGTRIGATAFKLSGKTIKKDQLPAEFAPLTAAEIEDCLCIYKDVLSGHHRFSSLCGGQSKASTCIPPQVRPKPIC